MCGIAGIINPNYSIKELRPCLAALQERLRHRGPDDAGIFVDQDALAGLAHTRLAILDLSKAGHQPMSSDDGRYTITFNGEIYNFLTLRRELEDAGERFRSRADTEVILKLFARDGAGSVKRLEGMFALAIWDGLERRCFLARDPLGIKPLYVWRQGNALAFASEVRALLHAELGPKRLCGRALYEYLLYGSVQEPLTLVENIEALPAGQTLVWHNGRCVVDPYWKLHFGADAISYGDAVKTTRDALNDSIRRHFVSDVPVGIFLSGGIDSTALVALARTNGIEKLKTFCISFEDAAYNEGDVAAATAKNFETEHHDWRMTAADGRDLLESFLSHLDQPSNDGFNTFCVSKFARDQGMKVVLSGLGGDELFGGYKSFRLVPQMMAWHRRFGALGPLRGIGGQLAERLANGGSLRRLGAFFGSQGGVKDAYWAVRGIFTPAEARRLASVYTTEPRNNWTSSYGGSPPSACKLRLGESANGLPDQPSVEDTVSYLEMTRYMRNQLLRDSDVFSMAWGLELRVPLVDGKLVHAVGRLPAEVRLAAGKRLLLESVPELPDWVTKRPKRGFTFPFEQWMNEQWHDVFEEIERKAPVALKTWYRKWNLFTLNHFVRVNGVDCAVMEQGRREGADAGKQNVP